MTDTPVTSVVSRLWTRALAARCRRRHRAGGFTLIEILVLIGIIAVLIGLLLGVLSRVRGAQRSVRCLSTLRQIAGGFQGYVHDNGGHYPDPARANKSWEQMLLRYFRGPFRCEADDELYPAVESSYDWRDTGRPATTLAGRSIADVTRTDAVLAFEALPGWHARRKINIVRIDASASTVDDEACFNDLNRPVGNLADSDPG